MNAPNQERHKVLVIGGGTSGITVAARLRRAGVTDVAVVEPLGALGRPARCLHVAAPDGRPGKACRPVPPCRSPRPVRRRWGPASRT
jgi:sulfide:quinone oxidoreductase